MGLRKIIDIKPVVEYAVNNNIPVAAICAATDLWRKWISR
jgi:hypothetical protein